MPHRNACGGVGRYKSRVWQLMTKPACCLWCCDVVGGDVHDHTASGLLYVTYRKHWNSWENMRFRLQQIRCCLFRGVKEIIWRSIWTKMSPVIYSLILHSFTHEWTTFSLTGQTTIHLLIPHFGGHGRGVAGFRRLGVLCYNPLPPHQGVTEWGQRLKHPCCFSMSTPSTSRPHHTIVGCSVLSDTFSVRGQVRLGDSRIAT